MTGVDPWYLGNLVCPIGKSPLSLRHGELVSREGRTYPIVDGIPVMLVAEAEHTIGIAAASLERARGKAMDERAPALHLESLGISEHEKQQVLEPARSGDAPIDPVVACVVAATSGIAYRHLVGRLRTYPIPHLRLPESDGAEFLDIGCNWGRWSIAAARKGYNVVGVDPSPAPSWRRDACRHNWAWPPGTWPRMRATCPFGTAGSIRSSRTASCSTSARRTR